MAIDQALGMAEHFDLRFAVVVDAPVRQDFYIA
jgi:hypothetical protein